MYLGSREIRKSVPRNITLHAGVWGGDSSAAGAAKQYFNKKQILKQIDPRNTLQFGWAILKWSKSRSSKEFYGISCQDSSSQSSANFRPVRDPIEPLRQPEIFIWIESFAATIHSRRYQHWALEVDRPPLIIGEHFWDGKSFRNHCACNSFIVETLFCLWKTFRGTKISIFCLAIYILA